MRTTGGATPTKARGVVADDSFRFAHKRLAENNVDAEWLPIEFARDSALDAKTETVILESVVQELWVLGVWRNVERHEVAEIPLARRAQGLEQIGWGSEQAQVDVFGGSCAIEAELEREPSFQGHIGTKGRDHARQKALKYEELALASEVQTHRRARAQSCLERLFESLGRCIHLGRHAAIPPNGASARSTASS